MKGEESVSLPAALFFRGWTTLRVPSLGTMDNLFVRVSLVICWTKSLRSPRTLPRVVATNANFELRRFLGTSICHCFVGRRKRNLKPLRSPHRTPVQTFGFPPSAPSFARSLTPSYKPNTIQVPGLALSMEEGCRYLPVHRPDSRLHELSASSYQLRRSLGLMNRPRFASGYAAVASRDVPMGPFVGEEERESLGE